jgi:hypothetical protein
MSQCTATSKQSGERCKRRAAIGKSVCTAHGGKSLQGIASPTLKTGRYSKHLPTRLLATYDEAKRDPNILVLQDEIALVDSRISELLAIQEYAELPLSWPEITTLIEQRRKLVESERKRLVELQQVVTADQAMLLIRAVVASVREHVRDPATLRAITDDLARLALAGPD